MVLVGIRARSRILVISYEPRTRRLDFCEIARVSTEPIAMADAQRDVGERKPERVR